MRRLIYILSIIVIFILFGCQQDNRQKLVGSWYDTYHYEELLWQMVYHFDEDGLFEQSMIPAEGVGIGFNMGGTWKLEDNGELLLTYDLQSLSPILGQLVAEDTPEIQDVINDATAYMKSNNQEKWTYKIEFMNDNRLKISFDGNEDVFERIK